MEDYSLKINPLTLVPRRAQESDVTLTIILATSIVGGLAVILALFGGWKLRQAAMERGRQATYKLSDLQLASENAEHSRVGLQNPTCQTL
jgi:hypothetical protein